MRWLTRAFGGDARASRDVDGLLRSALLAVLDRDLDRAETCLKRALQVDSDGIEAYIALARLFRARGEVGRAIRIHQNLLLRADLPADLRLATLLDLGADFREGGFLKRAIATYEEVLERDSKNETALQALAELFREAREYPRAIEMARRASRTSRGDGAAGEALLHVAMADASRVEGRTDEARRAVKKALRRDKSCVEAWRLLGTLEAERGKNKAALAAWTRVPAIDLGKGPLVYAQIEATYASLGKAREYETWLRSLLEGAPGDAGARIALARTLAARGEPDPALAELRRVLTGDPAHLEARSLLVRTLLSEGRAGDAREEFGALVDELERNGLLREAESLE